MALGNSPLQTVEEIPLSRPCFKGGVSFVPCSMLSPKVPSLIDPPAAHSGIQN